MTLDNIQLAQNITFLEGRLSELNGGIKGELDFRRGKVTAWVQTQLIDFNKTLTELEECNKAIAKLGDEGEGFWYYTDKVAQSLSSRCSKIMETYKDLHKGLIGDLLNGHVVKDHKIDVTMPSKQAASNDVKSEI